MNNEEISTQAEFEDRTRKAIARGYAGIDRNGNPTNDMGKIDTVGPDLRAVLDGVPEQLLAHFGIAADRVMIRAS